MDLSVWFVKNKNMRMEHDFSDLPIGCFCQCICFPIHLLLESRANKDRLVALIKLDHAVRFQPTHGISDFVLGHLGVGNFRKLLCYISNCQAVAPSFNQKLFKAKIQVFSHLSLNLGPSRVDHVHIDPSSPRVGGSGLGSHLQQADCFPGIGSGNHRRVPHLREGFTSQNQ